MTYSYFEGLDTELDCAISVPIDRLFKGLNLPMLKTLRLSGFCHGAATYDADGQATSGLASATMPALAELELFELLFDDDRTAADIAAAPWYAGVEDLQLSLSYCDTDDLRSLLSAPFKALRKLDADVGHDPTELITVVASSPGLWSLESLTLSGNAEASMASLEALAAAPLHALRRCEINLGYCSRAMAVFQRTGWREQLEHFRIN